MLGNKFLRLLGLCVFTLSVFPAQGQILDMGDFVTAPELNDSLARLDSLNRAQRSASKVKQYPPVAGAISLWNGQDFRPYDSSFGKALPARLYTLDQTYNGPLATLGLNNGPTQSLTFNPHRESGIRLGLNPYGPLLQSSDSFEFYQVSMPFTRFHYSQGDGRFIGLQALHSQNFSPTWNSTVRYNSVLNQDQYPGSNQDHLFRNIQWGSHFVSPNGRLTQQSIVTWNRARRNENGGLYNDSSFYWQPDSLGAALRTFGIYQPWNLQAQSVFRRNAQTVYTRYKLADTSWALEYKLENERLYYQYSDASPDSAFYHRFIDDELSDSSAYHRWSQALGVRKQTEHFWITAHVRAESGSVFHKTGGEQRVKTIGLALEGAHQGESLNQHFSLLSNPFGSGYKSGDYHFRYTAVHTMGQHSLKLEASAERSHISLFEASFQSQALNGTWNPNRFGQSNKLSLIWSADGQQISLSAGQFERSYAFAQDDLDRAQAQLSSANGQYIQGGIQQRLMAGKHFHAWLRYQGQVIRINNNSNLSEGLWPKHWLALSTYFQGSAFQEALAFRLGIDAKTTSAYTAWMYRPDLGSFYAASAGGVQLGNYPVLDVFFTGRIQSVDISIKYEHLNEWWYYSGFNSRYESTYAYPILPARLRLAVVWNFFN
ncbi:MAG: hypothetical protein O3C22_03375 [Bacteroidetes bacterium]|nr:hypothetical protein [Bacteroidota bacterium]MDA0943762.1 hypothetical protein [Bacteroidota bacterium]MDA1111443.1 hypothetical protein [Bacteroidota bacterium]